MQAALPFAGDPPRALVGEALLAAWERGSSEAQPARALTLLLAGHPNRARPDAAAMSVVARDLSLLDIHGRTFGSTLAAYASCPSCAERLEFTLPCASIAAALASEGEADGALTLDGWSLRLRLANTDDIAAAASAPDLDAARQQLLARCATITCPDGSANPITALPQALAAAALARLAAMHDAADLSVVLDCPGCGGRHSVALDLPSFLWAEVRHAARRLVEDVHELAWTYGWAEQSILAMSSSRRQAYLEMVRA